jgi:hypothetical protein
VERVVLLEAIAFSFRERMRRWEQERGALLAWCDFAVRRSYLDAERAGGRWNHANGLWFLGLAKPRLRWEWAR